MSVYYYLLAWNSKRSTTITYRLDRMKGVDIDDEPREGGVEFGKINMKAYTQQHFGMFSGEPKTVSLRFTNNLLDTMVDRFGTASDVFYRPDDEGHLLSPPKLQSATNSMAGSAASVRWQRSYHKGTPSILMGVHRKTVISILYPNYSNLPNQNRYQDTKKGVLIWFFLIYKQKFGYKWQ